MKCIICTYPKAVDFWRFVHVIHWMPCTSIGWAVIWDHFDLIINFVFLLGIATRGNDYLYPLTNSVEMMSSSWPHSTNSESCEFAYFRMPIVPVYILASSFACDAPSKYFQSCNYRRIKIGHKLPPKPSGKIVPVCNCHQMPRIFVMTITNAVTSVVVISIHVYKSYHDGRFCPSSFLLDFVVCICFYRWSWQYEEIFRSATIIELLPKCGKNQH